MIYLEMTKHEPYTLFVNYKFEIKKAFLLFNKCDSNQYVSQC